MKPNRSDSLTLSRVAVWGFLLALCAVLYHGLISLPPAGETNPTFHVASRYLDHGAEETGLGVPFLAVLLDYRSFDLVLLSLFFLGVTLAALLFCLVENLSLRPLDWKWAWGSLLSSFGLLVLGGIGLKSGSNFMDYEFWSALFGPAARTHGAWITGALVFIALLTSSLWVWKILTLGKEKLFAS